MIARQKLYTTQEFRAFTRLPENVNRIFELADGVIVEMTPSRPINTVVAGRIIHFLNAHVIPNNLGWVSVPDGGYQLTESINRQPDAAFVSIKRLPKIPDEFNLAPDLAVEVVSPNEDVLKKVNDYLGAGCQIVWTVYADEKQVYVFTLDDEGALRGEPKNIDDVLTGGDVLPDFRITVRDIFPLSVSK